MLMMMEAKLKIQIVKSIPVKGTITITKAGADSAAIQAGKRNKQVTFKNFASFTVCISEINNIQVDNEKYLNVMIPMCNLIECTNSYAKCQEVYGSITKMMQIIT